MYERRNRLLSAKPDRLQRNLLRDRTNLLRRRLLPDRAMREWRRLLSNRPRDVRGCLLPVRPGLRTDRLYGVRQLAVVV